MNKPLISSFKSPWLTGATIKSTAEPFKNISPVGELGSINDIETKAKSYGITNIGNYSIKDLSPIPQTKDREHYHGDNHLDYWLSGLSDMLKIQESAGMAGVELKGGRYFELGCASGRVIRHVDAQTDAEVWCCDINNRHTEWVRMFLPSRIKIFHNTTMPYLPLQDSYFDVVAAFSVFTHIDDLETAWLMELRRILRSGGVAYITIQSDSVWEKYKQGWIKNNLMPLSKVITDYKIDEQFFKNSLPSEKTVIWWPTDFQCYNSTVFHTSDYIRREWGRLFSSVEIIRDGHTFQDVVVLKK